MAIILVAFCGSVVVAVQTLILILKQVSLNTQYIYMNRFSSYGSSYTVEIFILCFMHLNSFNSFYILVSRYPGNDVDVLSIQLQNVCYDTMQFSFHCIPCTATADLISHPICRTTNHTVITKAKRPHHFMTNFTHCPSI